MKDNFGLFAGPWRVYCLRFEDGSVGWNLEEGDLFLEVGTIKASSWGRIGDNVPISCGWSDFSALQPYVPSVCIKGHALIGVFIDAMLLEFEAKHIPLVKGLSLPHILLHPSFI